MRRLAPVACTLALLIVSVACSRSPDEINVGAVYPLSGSQGPGGRDEFRGVSLAVGMASMWWWMHRAASPPSPVAASASADRQVLYWYDPMQPNQHFDHPGKSPDHHKS